MSRAHAQAPAGKPDAGGFPAPTPELERGRAVYVLNACHFCHGIDLTGAQMGATDLMHAPIVAADRDGNVIGAVARAGKPNLQTAMPQYPELTAQQVSELAGYIHYLRQVGRYKELRAQSDTGGNAMAGEMYFAAQCSRCHSRGDFAGVTTKYSAADLRSRLLRPGSIPAPAGTDSVAVGRREHLALLEHYSDADVRNVLAFLRELAR
jgi:mono/diheme cytochrome c family protein